jgi:predicted dehydrogenase
MRIIVLGKGTQGVKRIKYCGKDFVASVDPNNNTAVYNYLPEVPVDDYDAACVCTPYNDKAGQIQYLLEHRKHILVEKPLWSPSQSVLKNLQHLADENKCVLYTAYNHRFEPAIIELKNTVPKLGKLYSVKLFLGYGTAKLVKESSWIDEGIGIFGGPTPHLLDLAEFIIGGKIWGGKFNLVYCGKNENKSWDHAIINTTIPVYTELEMSYLSWKNTFTIDVIGELGSVHVNGLIKWGKSTCEWRERILPSGKPPTHIVSWQGMEDPTWKDEYNWFKSLCNGNYIRTRTQNDLRINYTINKLVEQSQ